MSFAILYVMRSLPAVATAVAKRVSLSITTRLGATRASHATAAVELPDDVGRCGPFAELAER